MWVQLEASSTGTAVAALHRDFIFAASGHATEKTSSPDTSNAPHANAPTAVETLDALALLSLLEALLGGWVAEELVCTLRVGRSGANALLVDNMPHGANDTAVSAWCRDDGLDVRGIDGCGANATCRGLLAQTQGCVCGDLGATEHGFEREAHGKFETGAEECAEVPGVGVEKRVD